MVHSNHSIRVVGRLDRLMKAAACGAVLLVGACGGGGSGDGATPTTPITPVIPVTPATPSEVVVGNNSFTPSSLTVPTGTTVTWTWSTCTGGSDPYGGGQTCLDHSVAWDAASGTGSATQQTGTYQRQFSTAGTYTYHCAVHGAAMSGTVIVQ
jgi:plastocyanin